jgi:hypothetical protein
MCGEVLQKHFLHKYTNELACPPHMPPTLPHQYLNKGDRCACGLLRPSCPSLPPRPSPQTPCASQIPVASARHHADASGSLLVCTPTPRSHFLSALNVRLCACARCARRLLSRPTLLVTSCAAVRDPRGSGSGCRGSGPRIVVMPTLAAPSPSAGMLRHRLRPYNLRPQSCPATAQKPPSSPHSPKIPNPSPPSIPAFSLRPPAPLHPHPVAIRAVKSRSSECRRRCCCHRPACTSCAGRCGRT